MEGLVACVAYAEGRRLGPIELEAVSEILKRPGEFVWVGLHEPSEDLLRVVQREFGLHDLAVEDALRAHQRPKLELYGESLFAVIHTIQFGADGRELQLGETHFFLGRGYVVSVRHGSSLGYTEVRSRCEASPQLLGKGPGFVLYAVMDFIVDQYFPVVDTLEDHLEAIETELFNDGLGRETTTQLYNLKRDLLQIKRAVSPLTDVSNRLVRFDLSLIAEDTRPYFRDVYDHVIRINEMVDMLRELLTSALEANLSLISVRQNEAMKRLTGWAAIFAVPTMIAGIYGMNFKYMPELGWSFGYPLVMGFMVGLCTFLYIRFKRSGWL